MRRVSLCLAFPFVLACGPSGIVGIDNVRESTEETVPRNVRIQVQGTVTAADDGSPIAGAKVHVGKFLSDQSTQVLTNNQGGYSLSFIDTACSESFFLISASADGFRLLLIPSSSLHEFGVRCTDEPQTINFQLERETS